MATQESEEKMTFLLLAVMMVQPTRPYDWPLSSPDRNTVYELRLPEFRVVWDSARDSLTSAVYDTVYYQSILDKGGIIPVQRESLFITWRHFPVLEILTDSAVYRIPIERVK